MAKSTEKGGGGLAILAIVGTFMWILFSNLFNYPLIANYGIKQYGLNIKNFHSDYYCTMSKQAKVHETILKVSEAETEKGICTLRPGSRFMLKGYQKKGSVTWIAVELFNKNQIINGYLCIPKVLDISTFWTVMPLSSEDRISNDFFRVTKSATVEAFQENLENKARLLVNKNFAVNIAKGETNVQKIRESDQYQVIEQFSKADLAYYCPKQEHPKVDALIDAFIGDNFDTNFLQLNANYDPRKNGVYEKAPFLSLLSNWYFKLSSPFLVLLFFGILFRERHRCPHCRSKDFDIQRKRLVNESYKHERVNKERDKRFKDNPLIQRIAVTYGCNECGKNWTEEITQESDKNKGETKFASYQKARPVKTMPKPAAPASSSDMRTKLVKLKKLYEAGKIDQTEYVNMKTKILNCI